MAKAEVLERGNIYFFYRPAVEALEEHEARVERGEPGAEGIEDIHRFYLVLSPHGKARYRLMVIGQKKLPEIWDGGQKYWGFVEKVGRDPKEVGDELGRIVYPTKTRGERYLPAARPAGEGVYAIAEHDGHTHLAYALELPKRPGEAQRELNIGEEGSYVLTIRNPEKPAPPGAGLREEKRAKYPERLREKFKDRRFIEANPPDFLDYEGAGFLLIGAEEDVSEELGIELEPQQETKDTAEIFSDLRLEKSEHPTAPLFKGEWR